MSFSRTEFDNVDSKQNSPMKFKHNFLIQALTLISKYRR